MQKTRETKEKFLTLADVSDVQVVLQEQTIIFSCFRFSGAETKLMCNLAFSSFCFSPVRRTEPRCAYYLTEYMRRGDTFNYSAKKGRRVSEFVL